MSLPDTTLLGDAREWLRRRVDKGDYCPCCKQMAKVYRRKINAGMARSLIAIYQVNGLGWVHVPTQIGARSREEGKLAYWGLLEEEKALRPDGGRAGYWRVTPLGELFIKGQVRLPKYVKVYNGRPLSLDPTETVDIKDVIGDRFDLAQLMNGG